MGVHVMVIIFVVLANAEIVDFAGIQSILKAPDGNRGAGSHRHGANAKHLMVQVGISYLQYVLPKYDQA